MRPNTYKTSKMPLWSTGENAAFELLLLATLIAMVFAAGVFLS